MGFLIGLVVIVLGAVSAIVPEIGWHISEGWKFRDAEPSDAALLWTRISGIFCIVVGLYFVFKA